jgi:hypothetical protein
MNAIITNFLIQGVMTNDGIDGTVNFIGAWVFIASGTVESLEWEWE